VHNVKTKRW